MRLVSSALNRENFSVLGTESGSPLTSWNVQLVVVTLQRLLSHR